LSYGHPAKTFTQLDRTFVLWLYDMEVPFHLAFVRRCARRSPRSRTYLNPECYVPFQHLGATLMERFKRYALPAVESSSLSSHSRLRAAATTAGSGEHALRYSLVREVLLGYLSPILVDSVLERAVKARNLSPRSLTDTDLEELVSDIMVGLRLFVDEERLPKLMLALAEILGGDT
jgi:hypothetical protein